MNRSTSVLKKPVKDLVSQMRAAREPIAIVGMSCRFPHAPSVAAYRDLLLDGRDALGEIPPDRWSVADHFAETRGTPGKSSTRHGHFLERLDLFDADFFRLGPAEAAAIDPGHRLLLELGWETFESANIPPSRMSGTATAVFVGMAPSLYMDPTGVDEHTLSGVAPGTAVGRVSHFFNLHGPSEAIDASCAGSLVALHRACQALSSHEVDAALAGGVSTLLTHAGFVGLSQAGVLSSDGQCKTFDARADGYGRGEGGGLVLLKRLADAQRDGNRIFAVVAGSAVNHSGRTQGLTAPNGPAQQRVAREALKQARVEASEVQVIEAHGTGTRVGDAIEIAALGAVFDKRDSASADRVVCGTAKTNVGHLESAAGIAGLIKVVLMLERREIFPHLHLDDLSPDIDLARTPIVVPAVRRPWPTRGAAPRVGAVHASGFSGCNAHAVLVEATAEVASESAIPPRDEVIVPLSARSETGLDLLVRSYLRYLVETVSTSLHEIAHGAAVGREHFAHRLALVVSSRTELAEALRGCLEAPPRAPAKRGKLMAQSAPRVALVVGDAAGVPPESWRHLYEREPDFRAALDACEAGLAAKGHGGSLDRLFVGRAASLPGQVALQYALGRLWRGWGIRPSVVLADGLGELAAAAIADAVPIADVLALALLEGDDFHRRAATLTVEGGSCSVFSARTGGVLAGSPAHWRRDSASERIRAPEEAMLVRSGASLFVVLGQRGATGATGVPSLEQARSAGASLHDALATLYARGVTVDWNAYHRGRTARTVTLPTYPFERTSHWLTSSPRPESPPEAAGADAHPLLGKRVDAPSSVVRFMGRIDIGELDYLEDHRLYEVPVFPPMGFLEMAFAAARAVLRSPASPGAAYEVRDLVVENMLPLSPTDARVVHTSLMADTTDGSTWHFAIESMAPNAPDAWILHATGKLRSAAPEPADTRARAPKGRATALVATREGDVEELYARLADQQLHVLGRFRALRALKLGRHGSGVAAGALRLDPAAAQNATPAAYLIHPALLESGLQLSVVAGATRFRTMEEAQFAHPFVLHRIERATLRGTLLDEANGEARVAVGSEAIDPRFEAALVDPSGLRALELSGIAFQPMDRAALDATARHSSNRWPIAAAGRGVDPSGSLGPSPSALRSPGEASESAPTAWAARVRGMPPPQREAAVLEAVRAEVARALSRVSVDAIGVTDTLREHGLDSLGAVRLRDALGALVGVRLPITLAYDHPSPAELARHLLEHLPAAMEEPSVSASTTGDAPAASTATAPHAAPRAEREAIAIVGLGCRFPGGATDPESFWRLLEEGVDAVIEVPRDRWEIDRWYDPDPDAAGKMTTRWGAFLRDLDLFDPEFFGISRVEAPAVDPQLRLLLETTWEALEHAGIPADRLMGSETGVFMGLLGSEYQSRALSDVGAIEAHHLLGSMRSSMVGRLSYWLGLKGPNMLVDTACSSSLVAVHLGCQALLDDDCRLALVGGANVTLDPLANVALSRLRALSPTGRCRAFSDRADGYVRAEGAGVVVLERLSDARKHGHRVLAVIRGSAMNQDGRSNGPTAPHGPSQEAVIRRALARGGVHPLDVQYLECHGTGTALGDPIEVHAAGAVLGEGRDPERPLILGALKSNIGHAEGAAGVGGLIKAVLALEHGRIPKTLHCETLNSNIPWDELRVRVATESVAWPRTDRPRIAAVSSFGISGTNAHVVLEEPPPEAPPPERASQRQHAEARPELVVLSAQTSEALEATARRLREDRRVFAGQESLGAIAHTLAATRTAFPHRVGMVVAHHDELVRALEGVASGETPLRGHRDRVASGPAKIGFLFSGQGSQVSGMGRTLHAEWPAFREAFDAVGNALDPHLDVPLKDVMWADAGTENARRLEETRYAQCAIFALQIALAELWKSWGSVPDVVMGHSIGEAAAACVAGVFDLADGARLVAARARLMQALPAGGAMVAVETSASEIARQLDGNPRWSGEVSIAAINGPRSVVLSGSETEVMAVSRLFGSRGARTKKLSVSHAFHSKRMAPMLDEWRGVLESLRYHRAQIPVVSTVTGALAGDEISTAAHWVEHVQSPVRFEDGVKELRKLDLDALVELGPTASLLGLVEECDPDSSTVLAPSLRPGHGEREAILTALGAVFVSGREIRWEHVFEPGRKHVDLPTYAWQRERYWLDRPTDAATTPRAFSAPGERHPESAPGWLRRRVEESVEAERTRLIEEHLCSVVRQVLGKSLPQEEIRAASVMDLGLDSLALVRLRRQLVRALALDENGGSTSVLAMIVESGTLAGLAATLAERISAGSVRDGHAEVPRPSRLAQAERTVVLAGGTRAVVADLHRTKSPTVILVHGAGANHHYFSSAVGRFEDVRLVIPCLPGRCVEGAPLGSVAEAAGWLRELVEAMDLRDVVIAGHSYGGVVAIEAALQEARSADRRRRIAGLVVMSAGPRYQVDPEVLAEAGSPKSVVEIAARLRLSTRLPVPVDDLMECAAAWALTPPSTARRDVEACAGFDRGAELSEITIPVLVASGDSDALVPLADAASLARYVASGRLVTMPGVGHHPILEQPDRIHELVRDVAAGIE